MGFERVRIYNAFRVGRYEICFRGCETVSFSMICYVNYSSGSACLPSVFPTTRLPYFREEEQESTMDELTLRQSGLGFGLANQSIALNVSISFHIILKGARWLIDVAQGSLVPAEAKDQYAALGYT